jgi:hypothetical protein
MKLTAIHVNSFKNVTPIPYGLLLLLNFFKKKKFKGRTNPNGLVVGSISPNGQMRVVLVTPVLPLNYMKKWPNFFSIEIPTSYYNYQ